MPQTIPSDKILKILDPNFEQALYFASLACLDDRGSKLRYNNFAYSLRELSRHFLHRIAPNENVERCSWFEQVPNTKGPTRSQRIRYAIQGGANDDFLESIDIIPEEYNHAISAIKNAIDSLNKFTHISEDVFGLRDTEVDKNVKEVDDSFESFVELIDSHRIKLKEALDTNIEDHMINAAISEAFTEINSLAPHYSLDEVYVDDYHVVEINESEIVVLVEGSLSVTLMYGSNSERREGDGLDIEDSYAFNTHIRYQINGDFPNDHEVDEFGVDTSSWYQ